MDNVTKLWTNSVAHHETAEETKARIAEARGKSEEAWGMTMSIIVWGKRRKTKKSTVRERQCGSPKNVSCYSSYRSACKRGWNIEGDHRSAERSSLVMCFATRIRVPIESGSRDYLAELFLPVICTATSRWISIGQRFVIVLDIQKPMMTI